MQHALAINCSIDAHPVADEGHVRASNKKRPRNWSIPRCCENCKSNNKASHINPKKYCKLFSLQLKLISPKKVKSTKLFAFKTF